MKTEKYYFILTVAITVLCFPALGQVDKHTEPGILIGNANPFLAGISKLYIVIVPLDAEANKNGSLWQKLQKNIEYRLNEADIEIVPAPVFDAGPKAYDIPELRVYIDMLKLAEGQQNVFRIQTSLSRAVCLTEQRSLLFKADVWRVAPSMQTVATEDIPAAVTGIVNRQIEEFIHAYLAANQKVGESAEATTGETAWPAAQKERVQSAAKPETSEYKYTASKNSKVFHKAECEWAKKIKPENLTGYSSRDEAVRAGKRPCKQCKP